MTIRNVPYIESEQISVYEKEEENLNQTASNHQEENTRENSKAKNSLKMIKMLESKVIQGSKKSEK